MANNKTGFPYYNTDTDRYQDIRIKRLKKDFKCRGVAVYDYILCEIYRVRGCFLEWDENTAFDVAEYWGLEETTVNEIVNYCCAVGLFDKELFTNERVLTSRSIQLRFAEMCRRSKRAKIIIPDKINLLREEIEIIPEESSKTPEESSQSKVKKRREKKYPPLSPRGTGGGSLLNFDQRETPPEDGVKRNYEALVRQLTELKVDSHPDFFNKICELSNFGEIGSPVWPAIQHVKESNGKITMPAQFILSRIRNHEKN